MDPIQRAAPWTVSPAVGGAALLLASLAGLACANSPLAGAYQSALDAELGANLGGAHLRLPVRRWITDGLMSLFFLGLTLEIKRELLAGHLRRPRQAALPALGALGGMAAPALVYLLCARSDADAVRGWAIPVATDAAFVLPVLATLGSRVPPSVRAFVVALAIFDDVLAVLVIAVFYTGDLAPGPLWMAAAAVAVLGLLNRTGVRSLAPYLLVGAVLWPAVRQSGLHATLAGVLLALAIPAAAGPAGVRSPLVRLESGLQPITGLLIVPLFAFASTGVTLAGYSAAALAEPVALGALLGLLLGKPVGVFGAVWLAARLKLAPLPAQASLPMIYGVALLCGIGFTVSLFIATLSFSGTALLESAKLGIFAGSVLSALSGWLWLRMLPKPPG